MALSVHLPEPWEPDFLGELKRFLRPGIRLSSDPAQEDFRILVAGRPEEDLLRRSPDLKALIVPFAGIPMETRERLRRARPDLPVHNLHHNAIPTAEFAIALLMTLAKRLVPADRDLRRGDWSCRYAPDPGLLLSERNATVLGFGAVGQRVARMTHALGLRTTAIRRSTPAVAQRDGIALRRREELPEVLETTDVLMLCLPETAETHGILDREAIGRLSPGALLVNISRGGLIDEAACFEALTSGQLGGAAFDAWWRYPEDEASRTNTPPAAHPFWELDNVVLSPHRGGRSDRTGHLRALHLAGLLNAADRKDPIPNRVSLERGY
ncbi:MAG: NAD(P)-dependent oxidoreductase [Planctomycetota bacterium]